MTDSGEDREKEEGRELNLETEEGEGHRFSMSGKKKCKRRRETRKVKKKTTEVKLRTGEMGDVISHFTH